jgi:hypothetical protein
MPLKKKATTPSKPHKAPLKEKVAIMLEEEWRTHRDDRSEEASPSQRGQPGQRSGCGGIDACLNFGGA